MRQRGLRLEQRLDPGGIAKEQEAQLGPLLEGTGGTVDDGAGCRVAPHPVERQAHAHRDALRADMPGGGQMAASRWCDTAQRLLERSRSAASAAKAERAAASAASFMPRST